MNARLGLACLLLVAVPLIGALAPGAEEEAPEATAESEPATTAGGEIEATFSPTERVPADASIRFPVDI